MSSSIKSKSERTVWVNNVAYNLNKDDLFNSFNLFGNILDIQLPPPQEKFSKLPHRGYGFIEFDDKVSASIAIDNMDLNVLSNQVIKCNYAKPLKAAQLTGENNKPIWSTEEWLHEFGTDDNKVGNR